MFSLFLLSYRNTCESLGELEQAAETLAYWLGCARYVITIVIEVKVTCTSGPDCSKGG